MLDVIAAYWVPMVLGLLLAFLPYVRKASTYYTTLIHEIGHGVSSLNPTGGLGGISIRPDSSGENRVTYRGGGLFYMPIRIMSLMSGYAAPIYVGAAFWLVAIFNLDSWFKYVMLIVCALTLLAIRNLFGALIILLHAVFWAVVLLLNMPLHPVLTVLGTVLIARGFVDLIGVTKYSFMPEHKGLGTDFDLLQEEFLLPRQIWWFLFCIIHTVIIFVAVNALVAFSTTS